MNDTNTQTSTQLYLPHELDEIKKCAVGSYQLERIKSVTAAPADFDFDRHFNSISIETRPAELAAVAYKLSDTDFWRYVRKFWYMGCDNSTTLNLINGGRAHREFLMNEIERQILEELPDELVIYHGCPKGNDGPGWSWSLSEQTAHNFATVLNDDYEGILFQGQCSKLDAIAYLGFMHEDEILVNPKCVYSTIQRTAKLAYIEKTEGKASWIPFDTLPTERTAN